MLYHHALPYTARPTSSRRDLFRAQCALSLLDKLACKYIYGYLSTGKTRIIDLYTILHRTCVHIYIYIYSDCTGSIPIVDY